MTTHRCECSYFSHISCAAPMTQEDLLCDPCRDFKQHGKSGSLHLTDLANPSPHETLLPHSLTLAEVRDVVKDTTRGVRIRAGKASHG